MRVLILGSGKIGSTIASFLFESGDYDVSLASRNIKLTQTVSSYKTLRVNAETDELEKIFSSFDIVISALSYYQNIKVAISSLKAGVSYFDLTEDETTLGKPSCGDITEGKTTLPLIYMKEVMGATDREHLDSLSGTSLPREECDWVAEQMRSTGAQEKVVALCQEYVDSSLVALEQLPESGHRDTMRSIAEFVLIRHS